MIQSVLLILLTLGSALAAPVGFEIPVPGSRALPLAVAAPLTPEGDPAGAASTVRDTLEHDLDLTGYFDIVPPAAHIERAAGVAPGEFDWGDWTTIRVAALVKARLWPAGTGPCGAGKTCLDLYVYDVGSERKLAGKRLRVASGQERALAHEAANLVLEALVGQRGFFDGTLAAVREVDGHKEIFLVGVDGEGARAVTRNRSINLSPAWSPDHRRVAFTTWQRGNPDVFVKDLPTGSIQALSTAEGLNASPSFSPDGRLVALARADATGDTDLFLVDARTGEDVRQLTTGGGIDVSPHFSPDGTQIVFASERSGGSQIYVVPTAGGEPRRVTRMGGFFTDPVWSPDGERIAFVSRQGGFDVLTVRADGTGMVRITQDTGDNEDPTWSPDGKYLVFSSTRDGARRLWLSTADGRHQVRLTASAGWSQPTWTR